MGSILIDEAAMARVRHFPCDLCGAVRMPALMQAHHIVTRQMGGGRRVDMAENLLCVCSPTCHELAARYTRTYQFRLAAKREGIDPRTAERRVLKAIKVKR